MDYLSTRQNPVPEKPEEMAAALEAVARHFGEDWLERNDGAPLQALWRRQDTLATAQLCTLGIGLNSIEGAHPTWIKQQVRAVKLTPSNRRGAMFELVALPMFRRSGVRVRPTRKSHPGYDGVIEFNPDGELHTSFKNFGSSAHEEEFKRRAAAARDLFVEELQAAGRNGFGLLAVAQTYPTSEDWDHLQKAIRGLVTLAPTTLMPISSTWFVRAHPLPDEYGPLSCDRTSYQALILGAYHPNEPQNLLTKLDAAAAGARKYASGGEDVARALLLRFHEDSDLATYQEWAKEYASEHPNGPLDLVLLYQVTRPSAGGGLAAAMHHVVVAAEAESYRQWLRDRPHRLPSMVAPIGSVSATPSHMELADTGIKLPPSYVFQNGEYFVEQLFADGAEGVLEVLASGIHKHVIFRDERGSLLLQGILPPTDSITLFD